SLVANLVNRRQRILRPELWQAGSCRSPGHPRPEHVGQPARGRVWCDEPAWHRTKDEQLYSAVAPTQRVGPGIAAPVDECVEEEAGVGVMGKPAPRFGSKELASQMLPFGWRQGGRRADLAGYRAKARFEKGGSIGVVL